MNRSPHDELTIGIRLGFWGLTLFVAYMVYCLLLAIFEPAAGFWSWMLAISGLLTLVLGSVVAVLGAYRLSRALGCKMVERIAYGALMLLPLANFILLWMLRDRGVLKRDELHLRDLAQESRDAPPPAPSLAELVAEAMAKPEVHPILGRFTRGTLWTLGISGGLSGGLLAVFLVTNELYYRLWAGILAVFPCALTVAALIKAASEAASAAPPERKTPELAVTNYVRMVNQQRWPEALSCLSWITCHGRVAIRPAIPEWGLAPAAFHVRQPDDLEAYWNDLGDRRKFSDTLGLRCRIVGVDYATETSAMVSVEFPAGVSIRWPVYQRDGQWYLLQVGFSAPEQ